MFTPEHHPNPAHFEIQRRDAMSSYERQIQATAKIYDEAMRAAEQEDIEILSSVVPGSRLHEVIHNPIDSGIDEG